MSEQDRAIWNRLASRYDRIIPWFSGRYPMVRERLRRDLAGAERVLEVAAGTGQFTLDIAAVAREVVATDVAPEMVLRLGRRVSEAGVGNVQVREMGAEAIDAPDEAFDAVVCGNLLHVMERPEVALAELARVLCPDGVLVAPTFCHGQTVAARGVSSLLSLVSPFVAHTRFSDVTLARFVGDHGLAVEVAEPLGGWLPEVYLRARKGAAAA